MNNIIKKLFQSQTPEPEPYLIYRDTIQNQVELINQLHYDLESKTILLSAAMANLNRMDAKLLQAQKEYKLLDDIIVAWVKNDNNQTCGGCPCIKYGICEKYGNRLRIADVVGTKVFFFKSKGCRQ